MYLWVCSSTCLLRVEWTSLELSWMITAVAPVSHFFSSHFVGLPRKKDITVGTPWFTQTLG